MHENYDVVKMDIPGTDASQEEKDAFNKVMDAWQEAMLEDQKNIAKLLNVTLYTAGLIQYLRTRSRWTEEKEAELVRLDQAGETMPNVLAGEL